MVSSDPRLAVGVVGLGNMGTAMAERLLAAEHRVVVYNRTGAKTEPLVGLGATAAETIAELAGQVDVVLTSLANDGALEAVAADVLAAARPGTVLVDTSTVSPAASASVAERAEAASVAYLCAPVSGNPAVVRAGNLTFIVSGAAETLARAEGVLHAIGPTIHHVGEGNEARIVKLAINLMIGGIAELMSEALVLGEGAGVARQALLEVMGTSAAGAPFVRYKTEPLLRDDFSATFTTTLMEKDIDLVLDAADEAGVQLPLAAELKSLLRATVDAGYADYDFMALLLRLRSASDQEVVR